MLSSETALLIYQKVPKSEDTLCFHIKHFTVSAFWARFQEWFSPLTALAGVSRSTPG